MVLAIVPAAPPTRKNRRATSWPAPISAKVPYLVASRLIRRAFSSVPISISGSIQFLLRRFSIAANSRKCVSVGCLCQNQCLAPEMLPHSSLGHSPRTRLPGSPSAESAIQIGSWVGARVSRACSAAALGLYEILGRLPQAQNESCAFGAKTRQPRNRSLESHLLGVFRWNPTAQIVRQRSVDPITPRA